MKLEDTTLQDGDIIKSEDGLIYIKSGKYFFNVTTFKKYKNIENEIIEVRRPKNFNIIYGKEILDDVEKEYLRNIIKPFKKRTKNIEKIPDGLGEFIRITVENIIDGDDDLIDLPYFKENEMYKGMEVYREYTLEELGL